MKLVAKSITALSIETKKVLQKKKAEYIKLRNEFIEKLRVEYPQMTDAEVFNFSKIYLLFNEDSHTKSNKSNFLFDERIPINRISWMGPYLQKAGDWKYYWLVENLNEGIHHP